MGANQVSEMNWQNDLYYMECHTVQIGEWYKYLDCFICTSEAKYYTISSKCWRTYLPHCETPLCIRSNTYFSTISSHTSLALTALTMKASTKAMSWCLLHHSNEHMTATHRLPITCITCELTLPHLIGIEQHVVLVRLAFALTPGKAVTLITWRMFSTLLMESITALRYRNVQCCSTCTTSLKFHLRWCPCQTMPYFVSTRTTHSQVCFAEVLLWHLPPMVHSCFITPSSPWLSSTVRHKIFETCRAVTCVRLPIIVY